jgi:NadR type nicotinamide-nucleotide adenylyltransferase
MAAAVETIPLPDRVAWLRAEHRGDPNVRIVGIRCDAPMDVTDEQVWAAQVAIMQSALVTTGGPVDVDAVFSGEEYGAELARRFGAAEVYIPRSGISSSAVRRDLAGRWADLAGPTRAGLAVRIVVVGAESTGTTTIANLLTKHYRARGGCWAATQCVEEYGREYTELKWNSQPGTALDELVWETNDFDVIAAEQTRKETIAAECGSPVLICDTDAFATAIWERRYLSSAARSHQAWTAVAPRSVYLVTDHQGVQWHDDGLREGDLAVRKAMTNWFTDALTAAGHSWVLLTGSLPERLNNAIRTIDPFLVHRAQFGEPLHGPGFEPMR